MESRQGVDVLNSKTKFRANGRRLAWAIVKCETNALLNAKQIALPASRIARPAREYAMETP
jgi:hypothetical protein